jgi:hypothetical protein
LGDTEVVVWHDRPFTRRCHHHVTMINGIDPQHLRTVHGLSIEMELAVEEHPDRRTIDFTLSGPFPDTLLGKLSRRLVGPRYTYTMRYTDASVGLLSTAVGLTWLGRGRPLPTLHTGYAYQPVAEGETRVFPFFVAPAGKGLLSRAFSRLLLLLAFLGFRLLKGQDGRVYDQMRFDPACLLPVDAPVARFIAWVNHLQPCDWGVPADPPPAAVASTAASPAPSSDPPTCTPDPFAS